MNQCAICGDNGEQPHMCGGTPTRPAQRPQELGNYYGHWSTAELALKAEKAENAKLRADNNALAAMLDAHQRGYCGDSGELLKAANLQIQELQKRYDKYAQHDRDCAVIDDPEYNKCSCGFLDPAVKRFTPHDHAYGICDEKTCPDCIALKPKGAEGVCPLCYSNYNDPAGKCQDHTEKRIESPWKCAHCGSGRMSNVLHEGMSHCLDCCENTKV